MLWTYHFSKKKKKKSQFPSKPNAAMEEEHQKV